MITIALLLSAALMAHAAPDLEATYDACVKASADDEGSARCLVHARADVDRALEDAVAQLTSLLRADAASTAKAELLETAHARWLPSRDADCALQGAVTTDSAEDAAEDAAEASRLCAYQASVPRWKQYQRFLGFLRP